SEGGGEGNGSVATGPMTWDASNFPAFWHEGSMSGEMLAVVQPDLSSSQPVINGGNLIYNTTRKIALYRAYTETGLMVRSGLDANGLKSSEGGYYAKVGWLGKPYVAVNGQANKLSKLVLEQNTTVSKDLSVGETWDMGDGYNLTLQSIDTHVPRQARLVLNNGSEKLDDKIIQEDQVYTYVENSLAGGSDVPLFVTYVENISENSVILKYTWLISDNVTIFNTADRLGMLEVISSGTPGFDLENMDGIALNRGTTINLLDGLYIAVNDSPSLEYYPVMTAIAPVIKDTTVPAVTNLSLSTFAPRINETVKITANISDNADLNTTDIFVVVRSPGGYIDTLPMIEMIDPGNGTYYYSDYNSTSEYGRYNVSITAGDLAGNINDTEKTWFVTTKTSSASTMLNGGKGETASGSWEWNSTNFLDFVNNETLKANVSGREIPQVGLWYNISRKIEADDFINLSVDETKSIGNGYT
ncbi:MAG: S-layer protein domain-containing protein, partial [Candidatus Methanoperedens sp.]